MRPIIEASWASLQETLGSFGVFLAAYSTMAVLYGLGGLLFYFVDKSRVLDKYKIQPGVCYFSSLPLHAKRNLAYFPLYPNPTSLSPRSIFSTSLMWDSTSISSHNITYLFNMIRNMQLMQSIFIA